MNTARKPRDRRIETRKRQREASIRSWAVYSLFALLCTTFGAKGEDRSTQPTAPPLASRSVPLARVDTKMIRLPLVDGRDIRFRQIPAVNGLSQTRAGTTVQDRLGFLWFGTQYGLDRFDGSRFKVFRHEPGDPNSLGGVYVKGLFVDHSGTLWVGCDQSLDRFDPVTETFTHFRIGRQGMNEGDINISEDHYGKLWLATAKGLFMLDPANGHTVRYTHDPNDPSSLSGNEINFADEDRQGTFWVASSGELDAFD